MQTKNTTNYKFNTNQVVSTKKHNYSGKVIKVFPHCPQDSEWIKAQSIRVRSKEIKEPWYRISVFSGGVVCCSERDLELIQTSE